MAGLRGLRAHPRSRGENPMTSAATCATRGSSPLTRGKRSLYQTYHRKERLIPAHAGKTFLSRFVPFLPRAHPRSRGENCTQFSVHLRGRGSSPLTRGKHSRRRAQLFDCGLIPAHAGKTVGELGGVVPGGAHPRSRGENTHAAQSRLSLGGSSPLTRGKLDVGVGVDQVGGLIPAHAGKTASSTPRSTR